MRTFHIHIEGQVQGVGFRPFVYQLARSLGIPGTVSNGLDGVHIFFNATEGLAQHFYQKLLIETPQRAKILHHSMAGVEPEFFTNFEIVESSQEGQANLLLTPDLGLCDDCRRELHDPDDRRFGYPFTTCINCGPRYSIMQRLPYDRVRTTMAPFTMCQSCQSEYDSPLTRRHFSQTNSCPNCAVELQWSPPLPPLEGGSCQLCLSDAGKVTDINFRSASPPSRGGRGGDPAISLTLNALAAGQILAIKGIGGYLLICDATNPAAVPTLRERKHRPSKPFALMYPNLEILKNDAYVTETEVAAFGSIESPIVLCRLLENPASGIDVNGISPHLNRIGAMQPYTPLMELILSKWQKPIVATSGNLSGSPIFFEDEKALTQLNGFVDGFLVNNREILLPQDDSVVQFTPVHGQRIVLRRSRGYAPTYIHGSFPDWQASVLAMGADLKSTFSLQHAGNTYVSQYLGDLESYDTQENFEKTLWHFLRLFDARPERVIVDMHPAYFSSGKGREIADGGQRAADGGQIEVLEVQHHVAHFAAVLAENELLTSEEPVLGVIWDGTGWGGFQSSVRESAVRSPQSAEGNVQVAVEPDATGLPTDGLPTADWRPPTEIWGGEFFLFENGTFERVAHLDYFPHFLGDKMSREPRLSALALCHDLPEAEPLLRPHFTEKEWEFYQKMLTRPGSLRTSSMGRFFDGVAALLDVQSKSSFEGEAAMRLEALASRFDKFSKFVKSYPPSAKLILKNILTDLQAGVDKSEIAFNFHLSLARWVGEMAEQQGVRRLAFSGGVFQNALLIDLIISELGKKFKLYFHKELSPNDECISFGQLAVDYLKSRGGFEKEIFPQSQMALNDQLAITHE